MFIILFIEASLSDTLWHWFCTLHWILLCCCSIYILLQ